MQESGNTIMKDITELSKGLTTAYIDGSVASEAALRPQFISNDYKEGRKVLSSIEDELLRCDCFRISVAFITMGGVTPLLQTLKEHEAARWLDKNTIDSVDWLPADVTLIEKVKEVL